MADAEYPPISSLRVGLRCRCPRCGRGKLFAGYLDVAASCAVCGLDLSREDAGDGPAVLVVLVVGIVVVGLALMAEIAISPPMWLHLVVWVPDHTRPFAVAVAALQGDADRSSVQTQGR